MTRLLFKIIAFLLFAPTVSFAQSWKEDSVFIHDNYTKREVFITMRDGVRLFTAIYEPKDKTTPVPILMERTPYSCSPYGTDKFPYRLAPNRILMKEKYIVVYQDVRGRYKSEGNFKEMTPAIDNKKSTKDVDESSDTYDTVDWLIKNTKSNGRVGLWGISYPGFYASASLPDAHPAIKAVSPQAPVTDEFIGDDCNHNGAFFLLDNFDFFNYFDGKRSKNGEDYSEVFNAEPKDMYKFFLNMKTLKAANGPSYYNHKGIIWQQSLDHDTYDDFWKSRNIRPHLQNVKPATLVVGGWFDAEDMFGALRTYEAIEKQSPHNNNHIVMGPWTHGGWAAGNWNKFGTHDFGSNLNKFYQEELETKFFDFYLNDKGSFDAAEATVFETGSNQWKQYNTWPPAESKNIAYYFQPGKKLSTEKPSGEKNFDEYISDPNNPVPYTNGIYSRRNNEYLVEDQRFATKRPDVISFKTEILTEDVTLTGRIQANLFVSTTGTDADFIVKLIDVLPDNEPKQLSATVQMAGYQRMVRAEVFRGKFRNSYEKPEPFIPGKIEKVSFDLNEVAHTFKKGHRIMVQVQSSWFPIIDLNPQKFMKIPSANKSDFQKATIRIYHDAVNSSNIVLPVLNN
ncbi:MAG: CocE/NonD family hydrolase [Bacteroidota bacterium]